MGNSALNNSAGLSSVASALVCVACCSGLQPVQSRYRERWAEAKNGRRQREASVKVVVMGYLMLITVRLIFGTNSDSIWDRG